MKLYVVATDGKDGRYVYNFSSYYYKKELAERYCEYLSARIGTYVNGSSTMLTGVVLREEENDDLLRISTTRDQWSPSYNTEGLVYLGEQSNCKGQGTHKCYAQENDTIAKGRFDAKRKEASDNIKAYYSQLWV